jgi:hypothetical protein
VTESDILGPREAFCGPMAYFALADSAALIRALAGILDDERKKMVV